MKGWRGKEGGMRLASVGACRWFVVERWWAAVQW